MNAVKTSSKRKKKQKSILFHIDYNENAGDNKYSTFPLNFEWKSRIEKNKIKSVKRRNDFLKTTAKNRNTHMHVFDRVHSKSCNWFSGIYYFNIWKTWQNLLMFSQHVVYAAFFIQKPFFWFHESWSKL